MAREEQVRVPDIGDFDAVDVIEVLVSAGDAVEVESPLISLESDKATMDVPSPLAGRVLDVAVKTGDQVAEGDVILTLEVEEEAEEPESEETEPEETAPEEEAEEAGAEEREEREREPEATGRREKEEAGPGEAAARKAGAEERERLHDEIDDEAHRRAYASPAIRRFARQLGVDLSRVHGSGRKGRILEEDVQEHVKRALGERDQRRGAALPEMPVVDFSLFGEIERRPLTRIQKIAGPSLKRSWLNVPHVTQHDEADITELEAFRKAAAGEAKEQGVKLTPLAFVMRACCAMLREFPTLNSSLDPDGEHLVLKRYIHLGFAVDTEGGLLVPVIRDADQLGVHEIARRLADLSSRAREGKLKPDEMKGASFTISSLGGIGGTFFTPIVNAPEVAILGVSRHRRQPVWRDGEFVPRLVLPLSLSYDHRVIDGALAVRATTYLAKVLGDIRRLLL